MKSRSGSSAIFLGEERARGFGFTFSTHVRVCVGWIGGDGSGSMTRSGVPEARRDAGGAEEDGQCPGLPVRGGAIEPRVLLGRVAKHEVAGEGVGRVVLC